MFIHLAIIFLLLSHQYHSTTVPPGWDHWYALNGNSKYYNFTLTENGIQTHYNDSYLTDLLVSHINEFKYFYKANK